MIFFFQDIEFPTVTICGSGQYFGPVETTLSNQFDEWNMNNNSKINQTEEQKTEAFREFLAAVYKVENGTNILDILSTMISPELEAAAARNLLRHQQVCSAGSKTTLDMRKRINGKNLI